ncbi:MAG: RDD family protein [Candidatus Marinimicrobia bacterium]|nr:RDD family protein [Candidatus Neomarinimicrobiota bacterium]
MIQSKRDVKTILSRTAFTIPPHLIGKSLASPRRRLAAISVDLLIAALISQIEGLPVIAFLAIIFMLPLFFKGLRKTLKKKTQIIFFILGLSLLITAVGFKLGNRIFQRFVAPISTGKFENPEDSVQVTELLKNVLLEDSTLAEKEELSQALGELKKHSVGLNKWIKINEDFLIHPDSINVREEQLVKDFFLAFQKKDSISLIQLWPPMVELLAGNKLEQLSSQIDSLDDKIEELSDDLDEKAELLAEPSFSYIFKAVANDIGFSIGWVAVYMIFFWWLFDGSTPGKWLFHIKIIRMNGSKLKLWYCFERFSGFAAGVATGLLGFLQIYWDDNRQCIHDKIASTVVIRIKPARKKNIRHREPEKRIQPI